MADKRHARWFDSTDNYKAVTERALERKSRVFKQIYDAKIWEEEEHEKGAHQLQESLFDAAKLCAQSDKHAEAAELLKRWDEITWREQDKSTKRDMAERLLKSKGGEAERWVKRVASCESGEDLKLIEDVVKVLQESDAAEECWRLRVAMHLLKMGEPWTPTIVMLVTRCHHHQHQEGVLRAFSRIVQMCIPLPKLEKEADVLAWLDNKADSTWRKAKLLGVNRGTNSLTYDACFTSSPGSLGKRVGIPAEEVLPLIATSMSSITAGTMLHAAAAEGSEALVRVLLDNVE
eukprot:4673170-Prymnesium_polylepis.1